MDEQLSTIQIYQLIHEQGLGYTVSSYLMPDDIEDEELRELWITAQAALDDIWNFVNTTYV